MVKLNQLQCNQPSTLVTKTRAMLRERIKSTSLTDIADDAAIPYYWLRRFHHTGTEAMRRHSADRVQYLYEYLSGQRLAV